MNRLGLYRERNAKRASLHFGEVIGQLGDHREGPRAPLFADAYCKCPCGGTMRTKLDFILHTHNSGECIYKSQKPTRNMLDLL